MTNVEIRQSSSNNVIGACYVPQLAPFDSYRIYVHRKEWVPKESPTTKTTNLHISSATIHV